MNITSVFKLHDTVLNVSDEARNLVPKMPLIRSEAKLLSELVLCILSSQEKYEVALAIMKSLSKENALRIPKNKLEFKGIKSEISRALKNPVYYKANKKEYYRRLRFFSKKTDYIIYTIENIYLNDLTIKEILKQDVCIQETRRSIINYSCGLGPKQASMFLRNIGYHSEFAVLDKHVLDYMRMLGLTYETESSFSKMSSYLKVESELKSYAKTYNVNLIHLDLAIWTTMRTLKTFNG